MSDVNLPTGEDVLAVYSINGVTPTSHALTLSYTDVGAADGKAGNQISQQTSSLSTSVVSDTEAIPQLLSTISTARSNAAAVLNISISTTVQENQNTQAISDLNTSLSTIQTNISSTTSQLTSLSTSLSDGLQGVNSQVSSLSTAITNNASSIRQNWLNVQTQQAAGNNVASSLSTASSTLQTLQSGLSTLQTNIQGKLSKSGGSASYVIVDSSFTANPSTGSLTSAKDGIAFNSDGSIGLNYNNNTLALISKKDVLFNLNGTKIGSNASTGVVPAASCLVPQNAVSSDGGLATDSQGNFGINVDPYYFRVDSKGRLQPKHSVGYIDASKGFSGTYNITEVNDVWIIKHIPSYQSFTMSLNTGQSTRDRFNFHIEIIFPSVAPWKIAFWDNGFNSYNATIEAEGLQVVNPLAENGYIVLPTGIDSQPGTPRVFAMDLYRVPDSLSEWVIARWSYDLTTLS